MSHNPFTLEFPGVRHVEYLNVSWFMATQIFIQSYWIILIHISSFSYCLYLSPLLDSQFTKRFSSPVGYLLTFWWLFMLDRIILVWHNFIYVFTFVVCATYDLSVLLLCISIQKKWNHISKSYMPSHVYCSTAHKSQDRGSGKVPVNISTVSEMWWHIHSGILLNRNKEWTLSFAMIWMERKVIKFNGIRHAPTKIPHLHLFSET